MKTISIENIGFQALVSYLEREYCGSATICDIRNRACTEKKVGCDLILRFDDKEYYIELKASQANCLPTNIRFKHQTFATMYNAGVLHAMIVAYVYNLAEGPGSAKFKFFRFGDVRPDQVYVEPNFIVQPKQMNKAAKASGTESPIKDTIGAVIRGIGTSYDIGEIFNSKISEHMKLARLINDRKDCDV